MAKLTLKEIENSFYNIYEEHEYIKNVDLKATGMEYIIPLIVKENLEINKKDIRISWEGVIGEYCIYINNKWSGYIEWHHFEGFSENEYYQYNNLD